MSTFEIIGVIFGLVCVWLTAKKNIWCWPIGIVNVLAFIVMFYNAKLYPDVGLHIAYLILSVYGWFQWGKMKNDKPIINITPSEITFIMMACPAVVIGMGMFFQNYTKASAPFIDSTITVLSLVAQYFLARKVLQNWIIWIVSDVIAIGLYLYKGLYLTSALYLVYLLICIVGYKTWKKELQA